MVTGETGPGAGLSDLLPVWTDTRVVTDPEREHTAKLLSDGPTLSHSLAAHDHEKKGAAQKMHEEPEVLDLGWNEKKEDIPRPLVGGIDNEDLWLLVRRFDKVGYPS